MSVLIPTVLILASGWAQSYDLRLNVAANQEKQSVLYAELVDLQLSGMSMGLTGRATAKVSLRVTEAAADDQTIGLSISLSNVKAVFNEAEQSLTDMPPLNLKVDRHGKILKLELPTGSSAFDVLATGGAPVQLLVISMAVAHFPDKPVEVGEEWEFEGSQATPFGLDATLKLKGKLVKVENGKARIEYSATAYVPPFRAPNPLQPGVEMTVKNAVTELSSLVQVVDLATGLVEETAGRLSLAFDAEMEGWNQAMPVSVQIEFAGGPDEARAKAIFENRGAAPGQGQEQNRQGQARPKNQGRQRHVANRGTKSSPPSTQPLASKKPVELWTEWLKQCESLSPSLGLLARRWGLRLLVLASDLDKAAKTASDSLSEALLSMADEAQELWRTAGKSLEDELVLALGEKTRSRE
jgi:thiol-disulfide isomerase/thioredoxin